mmetsp:Transcript_15157/g.31190  ORF Transcript_15157/g.31190 Transcript_15157/m.31190 type:complete len:383 (+) Transcript_15157:4177-5325(+)|eukprot:CAMPEP_0201126690 /NCGR_PEP_ID=MMETSP0850-20130426/27053_1 /ASSEMBLY_ACC=CAM_ASM_000622 /TAXON_ID=183588 /ORGANISM="Pseudo-nitzschia fraudulenta, Strain WWA7" /LENGTH=382 /DNA_ID=CAMNT_0047395225 /DNA_START=216 /DNA_END=1364 /DNA_ORIENTATION=+
MEKPTRYDWKDSNLELFGSKMDYEAKLAAAELEEAWEGIGKQAGTYVWRVENFQIKPWPNDQYGQFFKGDSYIVLQSVGSDPANLKHDVHIWIGSESTQDEYGTAAYKMVEADEYLEGAAVQHRQIEGREADDFVHCFDHLQYLKGGIQSGFRHVVPTVEKPFFFKFRRRAGKKGELVQVPMSVGSMDSKTSFLLYANKSTVWAWQGRDCKPFDKVACVNHGERLCTLGTVQVIDQDDGDENAEFWNYLEQDSGGREIGDTATDLKERSNLVGDLEEFEPKLFRVDGDPSKPLEQVAVGEAVGKNQTAPCFDRSSLDDSDVFLLDTGWKIFVWMGNKADRSEIFAAMRAADRYAETDPRAHDLPVTMLKAGRESDGFSSFFE